MSPISADATSGPEQKIVQQRPNIGMQLILLQIGFESCANGRGSYRRLHNENGDLLGIEVKAAESLKADDFKAQKWFEEKHDGPTQFTGVVLYAGHSVIRISESLWGIPMSLMWS